MSSPAVANINVDAPSEITPMMAQYLELKQAHSDCLLFFRMGDFYELFFDDAVTASKALDITLTKRGQHKGQDIHMCGVPWHQAETYLPRLVAKGFKVAIADQMEDPAEAKKRGAKSVVRRDVTRIITPGTLTEESLLPGKSNCFLTALARYRGELAAAWIDISTGEFFIETLKADAIGTALARLEPQELLVPETLAADKTFESCFKEWRAQTQALPDSRFALSSGETQLKAVFNLATLDVCGDLTMAEICAAGALLDYVLMTQKGKRPNIALPKRVLTSAVVAIDAASRRNLELTARLDGGTKGSLIHLMDETVSAGGGRLLHAWVSAPLTDPVLINARLHAVDYFFTRHDQRHLLRQFLSRSADMARATARLTLDRGGPRDFSALRDGLSAAAELKEMLAPLSDLPAFIKNSLSDLQTHGALWDDLKKALAESLPALARDGGFIATGFHKELDEVRALKDESSRFITALQNKYTAETGINTLKIKHNNILGYFIEVTAQQASKIPYTFIHRQTMASAMRFSTPELNDMQAKIYEASDKALQIELGLFDDFVGRIKTEAQTLLQTAHALALADVTTALAELAVKNKYTRPTIDDSDRFYIEGGRHPVVEASLRMEEGKEFVPNDCGLENADRICLLTGPNMAGKSTYLRQNALIALMAQAGSFVPATACHIGVIDQLFCRVGAADDLARGRSTFMVEMIETATILHLATHKSLVILDEIGRGTATFDGLSIAWACLEYLHNINRCRALFATHYHELTALSARLEKLSCFSMQIKEWDNQIIFLHAVARGSADRSYGVHVAELAGLPAAVTARAKEILALLETGDKSEALKKLSDDLPLFSQTVTTSAQDEKNKQLQKIMGVLSALHPDDLSPKEALEKLYELKRLAE